jgi:hypothetical protein
MEQLDSLKRKAEVPPAMKKFRTNEGENLPTQHTEHLAEIPQKGSEQIPQAPTPSDFKNLIALLNEQKAINSKLREAKKQEKVLTVSNLLSSIEAKKELMPIDFKIRDLTNKYNEQLETNKQLEARIADLQHQINNLVVSLDNFKSNSGNRKSAIRYDISDLNKSTEKHEKSYEQEIQQLERSISFYKKLTGLEITSIDHHKYRCRVRIHHHELIFMLTFLDTSLDYELVSHTINGDKLESLLKMDINIDIEDAPALLYKLISSLLQK